MKDSYEVIADHFSKTRYRDWSEFAIFKDYIKSSDKVLDAGCGNGRLYDSLQELGISYLGVDISPKLIAIAQEKFPQVEFQVADMLNLPFPDQQFDVVLSIASLHHVPSKKLRQQQIREFSRVLKSNGYLIITVWNLWQKHYRSELFKYTRQKLFGQSKLDFGDIYWRWKNPQGEVLTRRYLHGFSRPELEKLVRQSGFKIIKSFYSKKGQTANKWTAYNLCLIAQKLI